jgi:hypothetical protein
LPGFVLILLILATGSVLTSSVAIGSTSPKTTIILRGDAVGSVRFGEAQSAAASTLVKLLGKSDGGVRAVNDGDCIISGVLSWSNFTAYFYGGTFDGYQTGNDVTEKAEPRFNGVAPQGLRVGDTLARAQRLYGSALSTSGEQNGVYAAITKTGTIRGYLSTEPDRAPATKVRLRTISAGSVGCPAMSPG